MENRNIFYLSTSFVQCWLFKAVHILGKWQGKKMWQKVVNRAPAATLLGNKPSFVIFLF